MKNQIPSTSPEPKSLGHYVWAVVIITLIGAIMTMGILSMRPTADPLIVLGAVVAALAPTSAAVLAFIKAQETHLSVNSRLDQFMNQHAIAAKSEGIMEGITQEQERVKEKQRHELLLGAARIKPAPVEALIINKPDQPIPNNPVTPE